MKINPLSQDEIAEHENLQCPTCGYQFSDDTDIELERCKCGNVLVKL